MASTKQKGKRWCGTQFHGIQTFCAVSCTHPSVQSPICLSTGEGFADEKAGSVNAPYLVAMGTSGLRLAALGIRCLCVPDKSSMRQRGWGLCQMFGAYRRCAAAGAPRADENAPKCLRSKPNFCTLCLLLSWIRSALRSEPPAGGTKISLSIAIVQLHARATLNFLLEPLVHLEVILMHISVHTQVLSKPPPSNFCSPWQPLRFVRDPDAPIEFSSSSLLLAPSSLGH